MRIGVAAMGESLESAVSDRFGRCPYFLIVESDAMTFEAILNPASTVPGGAGPAAVQELANRGVEVAIAGEFGPKAQHALEMAGIRSVKATGTARDAVANAQP